jgi:hypothetical protein
MLKATVKNNQYFSIGYGPIMKNCDMVVWQANGNKSKTTDLWSIGYPVPNADP